MKRYLFIGSVYPTIHGAAVAAKYLVELFENDKDVKIFLLNTPFNKKLADIEKFSIIKILKFLFYLIKEIKILIFKNIDGIIYIHSLRWAAFYKDSIFLRVAKFFNKSIILYAQGIGFDHLFYENLNTKKKTYVDKIMNNVSKLITVSETMKDEYTRWIDKENIYKIYNICEPIQISNETKTPKETINILYLSFVSEAKGIFDLLESFADLKNKYNNIRLIVCGSFLKVLPQEKTRFWEFIKENKLEELIDYRGQVADDEKTKAYNDADIFVLPTHRESFGIVNIEAMSAGLPIVSTYQGAIPEYIENGENGFIIEPGDTEGLTKYLSILIENPDIRYRMGENNIKSFKEKFSKVVFVKKWKEILIT